MKKGIFFYITILTLCFNISNAQRKFSGKLADIGFFLGGAYYLGDINLYKHFYSFNPAASVFYRYNINQRYAVKGALSGGGLSANDADFADVYKYQYLRNSSFSKVIFDASVMFEFNFLNYSHRGSENKFTPYICGGVGTFITSNELTNFHTTVPFGLGFKFRIITNINAGIEWTFRKTFYDKIDDITGITDIEKVYKQNGFIMNNDWYSFIGAFIAFKLFNVEVLCPAYDNNR